MGEKVSISEMKDLIFISLARKDSRHAFFVAIEARKKVVMGSSLCQQNGS